MSPFAPMMSPGLVEEKHTGRIQITVQEYIETMLIDGWTICDIADSLELSIKDVQRLIRIYKIKHATNY